MSNSNSRDQILSKAYEIWEAEGRPSGKDMEHWLQAELVLANAKTPAKTKARAKAKAPAKAKAKAKAPAKARAKAPAKTRAKAKASASAKK